VTQLDLPSTTSPFDEIRRDDRAGEYWLARELMPLMQYAQWRDFAVVVEKAKASLALVQGASAAQANFADSRKVSGARGPAGADYRLTRFGAYLTAMAGDDTKEAVARARVYFAVKAREAEVAPTSRFAVPQSFADALQLAANQARAIEKQSQRIAALEPRAAQADHYRAAEGLTAIATFANDLQQWARENHGVKILHEQVRGFMAELGLLIRGNTLRHNEPTSDAIKRGLMRIKHSTYERSEGDKGSSASARLTQKGCGYVWDRAVKRIAANGSLAPIASLADSRPYSENGDH
jgi:phage antirepressor YoqD-like protein